MSDLADVLKAKRLAALEFARNGDLDTALAKCGSGYEHELSWYNLNDYDAKHEQILLTILRAQILYNRDDICGAAFQASLAKEHAGYLFRPPKLEGKKYGKLREVQRTAAKIITVKQDMDNKDDRAWKLLHETEKYDKLRRKKARAYAQNEPIIGERYSLRD